MSVKAEQGCRLGWRKSSKGGTAGVKVEQNVERGTIWSRGDKVEHDGQDEKKGEARPMWQSRLTGWKGDSGAADMVERKQG